MTNHQQKSIEHAGEVADLRADLAQCYRAGAASAIVAELHQAINVNLKLADIHATLAVAQAVEDRSNFQALAQ